MCHVSFCKKTPHRNKINEAKYFITATSTTITPSHHLTNRNQATASDVSAIEDRKMNLCFPDKEFSEQYLSSRSTKIDANRSQWQSFLSTSISQSKYVARLLVLTPRLHHLYTIECGLSIYHAFHSIQYLALSEDDNEALPDQPLSSHDCCWRRGIWQQTQHEPRVNRGSSWC